MRLYDLAKPGSFFASSLLIKEFAFLFVLQNQKSWAVNKSRTTIKYSAPGTIATEHVIEAAAASAGEIGCEVVLKDSARTLFVTDEVKVLKLEDRVKPAIVYEREVEGRPLLVAVYAARALTPPRPVDVPAVIWLTPKMIEASQRGVRLNTLLQGGALLDEREKIPRQAFLEPTGTPVVLLQLLKSRHNLVDYL